MKEGCVLLHIVYPSGRRLDVDTRALWSVVKDAIFWRGERYF